MRLLIVDDEPLIRSGIRRDLIGVSQVEIVGECETVSEAIQVMREGHIDLVLLDVRLPDGTGFDVIREVGPGAMPAVIFVTAYDSYAIQAFECSAVDYLLKPFDDIRLRASINRAKARLMQPYSVVQQLESLLTNRSTPWLQRLVVRGEERIDLVSVDSIDWIESANNYTVLHCGAKNHILGQTLTSLEQGLNPQTFLRIHRRRIINLARLVTLYPILGGVYEVELSTGTRLTTGRQYREGIQTLIRNSPIP